MKKGKGIAVFDGCQFPTYLLRGRILENPWAEPEEDMWRWTLSLRCPDQATYIELTFRNGDIIAINDVPQSPAEVMDNLNKSPALMASAVWISLKTVMSA